MVQGNPTSNMSMSDVYGTFWVEAMSCMQYTCRHAKCECNVYYTTIEKTLQPTHNYILLMRHKGSSFQEASKWGHCRIITTARQTVNMCSLSVTIWFPTPPDKWWAHSSPSTRKVELLGTTVYLHDWLCTGISISNHSCLLCVHVFSWVVASANFLPPWTER